MAYVETEIIASGLESAVWEMCASLIRTAYSPNVKERADCSTALCDVRGRTLALATHGPAHLGSTLRLVPAILERFPLETLHPGDAFFANDPYIVGVTHLNDCTVAAPVFYGDEPVAFAISVAHHSDVGGRVPGSESADSTSIYQEGIRLPPVKLYSAGELRRDIWELFLLNSRTPDFSEGDLFAQNAAIARGTERIVELYGKYGTDTMTSRISEILDATERRTRAGIRENLIKGSFSAVDWLDDDGINEDPVQLAVTATVEDDRIHFDFSECASQLGTGKNVPLTHTLATVYYCLKMMVDPDLPTNEGLYRTVTVTAPEGSIVNPRPPAAVSSRNLTSMILADVMMKALGQAVPARAMAAGGPYQGIILGGNDPVRERYFVDYENFAGGQGASAQDDGMDVVQITMSNTSNLPIEVMELEFPVRIEGYEIIPDSGGAGKHRGGTGVRRDLRILADDVVLATRSARQKFPAEGLDGGDSGSLGAYILNPGKKERRVKSTVSEFPLRKGDLLRVLTPGGGGFGHARERDPDRVLHDVREGKVSPDAARTAYGVVLTDDLSAVDPAATARLRGSRG